MATIIRARLLARVAAPVLLAAGLSACSWMPDWVDPTSWIGDDSQPAADQSAVAPPDNGAAASDESGAGQTPDLADIPAKPTSPSTPAEQKQVADSLAADRADAHYSAETLRGGTQPPAAPPPPAANPVSPVGAAPSESESAAAAAENSAPPAAGEETAPAAPTAEAATPSAAAAQAGAESGGAEEASPASEVASTEPVAPVVAPPAVAVGASTSPDMQTTFAPSKAPALDPAVAQYVPAQILSRYRATAAEAAAPGIGSDELAASRRHRRHRKTTH